MISCVRTDEAADARAIFRKKRRHVDPFGATLDKQNPLRGAAAFDLSKRLLESFRRVKEHLHAHVSDDRPIAGPDCANCRPFSCGRWHSGFSFSCLIRLHVACSATWMPAPDNL